VASQAGKQVSSALVAADAGSLRRIASQPLVGEIWLPDKWTAHAAASDWRMSLACCWFVVVIATIPALATRKLVARCFEA
jgi:hypothetical protein